MSFASANLFDVLSDPPAPLVTHEQVRQRPSSKKTDTPPPKANPARAKPKDPKKPANLNEAAFKNKSFGPDSNKSRAPEDGDSVKKPRPTRADRHDRHGVSRSETKSTRKAWGDEKSEQADETAGLSLAKQDQEQENKGNDVEEEASPEDNTLTLEEYIKQLSLSRGELSAKPSRAANEGVDESQWQPGNELRKNEVNEFEPATAPAGKTHKVKTPKAKTHIELETRFVSNTPRGGRGNRGGPRGSSDVRGHNLRGAQRGTPPSYRGSAPRSRAEPRPFRDTPSVDLGDSKDFPALGA